MKGTGCLFLLFACRVPLMRIPTFGSRYERVGSKFEGDNTRQADIRLNLAKEISIDNNISGTAQGFPIAGL